MKTMHLPVPLTEAELLVKGEELAHLMRKAALHKEESKGAAAAAKERLSEMELEASEMARTIREKAERRPVDVKEVRNEKARTIETIRLDTGAVVTSRSMTEHELTMPLFPEQPEAKPQAELKAEPQPESQPEPAIEEHAPVATEPEAN